MKILNIIMKIITVISLAVYPLFFNLLGGAGITAGAIDNHIKANINGGAYYWYIFLGIIMIISSVLMTSATVLLFGKKNISAVITDAAGTFLCIFAAVNLIFTADKNGLTDSSLVPYAEIYARRHLPTIIHFAAVMCLCIPEYIEKKKAEKQALHEFVYANSGIDEIMHLPDED